MNRFLGFTVLFVTLVPAEVWAAGEAAEVRQMFQSCINSGGRAASNYNDWVAQNGCICPGSSSGSGQVTCSGSANSSAPTSLPVSNLSGFTPTQQMGAAIGMVGVGMIIDGFSAASQQADQQAAQAQAAAAAQQAAQQQESENAKNRLLGTQKNTDPTPQLALKGADSSSDLHLKTDDDIKGSKQGNGAIGWEEESAKRSSTQQ